QPAGDQRTVRTCERAHNLHQSEAHVLVGENEAQWQKIAPVRDELPHLRHGVTMQGPADDDPLVVGWDAFMAKGEKERGIDDRLEALRPDTVTTYIYTSGTTGRPKAVMLTQDNLAWTAAQACELAQAKRNDRLVSYLPLSPVAEQMFTIHIAAVAGYPVYFAESLERLNANLVEVEPTL